MQRIFENARQVKNKQRKELRICSIYNKLIRYSLENLEI